MKYLIQQGKFQEMKEKEDAEHCFYKLIFSRLEYHIWIMNKQVMKA